MVLKIEATPDSKDDKMEKESPPLEGCGPTTGATAWQGGCAEGSRFQLLISP